MIFAVNSMGILIFAGSVCGDDRRAIRFDVDDPYDADKPSPKIPQIHDFTPIPAAAKY